MLVLGQPLEVIKLKNLVGPFRELTQEVVNDLAVPRLYHLIVAERVELVDAP